MGARIIQTTCPATAAAKMVGQVKKRVSHCLCHWADELHSFASTYSILRRNLGPSGSGGDARVSRQMPWIFRNEAMNAASPVLMEAPDQFSSARSIAGCHELHLKLPSDLGCLKSGRRTACNWPRRLASQCRALMTSCLWSFIEPYHNRR